MLKHWFPQGVIASLAATVLAIIGGVALTEITKQNSPWATPVLYGLIAFVSIAVGTRALKPLTAINPRNAGRIVRSWLDRVDAATKNVELPDFRFSYQVTLNRKIFGIVQSKSHPEYLHFDSALTFTEADNIVIANVPGGAAGVIRLMLICLAQMEIGHSGIETPLKKIVLSKRLLISSDLNEDRFIDALYKVEAALNLVFAIVAREGQLAATPPQVP